MAKLLKFEQRKAARKACRKKNRVVDPDPVMNDLVLQIQLRRPNLTAISKRCGVAVSTIRAWGNKTKRPQNATMDFVAREMGLSRGPYRPMELPVHGRGQRKT